MNHSLFVIAGQYRESVDRLADLDLDPQTFADTLESLSGDLETKATNVAAFIRNMEASVDAIKEHAKAMTERAKAIEKRAAGVRQYLLENMQHTGIKKIECPYFTISVRDNPASVVIDDERQIPAAYFTDPPLPPPQLDKTLIKKAIADGFDVPGARLERKQRLEIKT